MSFNPIFPDYYKVIVKFQSIVDRNKDLELRVRTDMREVTNAGRFIDIMWNNPCQYRHYSSNGSYHKEPSDWHSIVAAIGNSNLKYDVQVYKRLEIKRVPLYYDTDPEYSLITGIKLEDMDTAYDWEDKLEQLLESIRKYVKLSKQTRHEHFYDVAMHMVEHSDYLCEPVCIDRSNLELQCRQVFLDMQDYKSLKLRKIADNGIVETFTPEESDKLYSIRNYNEHFCKKWGHFIEKPKH